MYLAIHDVRLGHADTNIYQASDSPSYWEPPCWYIGPETGCSWFFSVFPGTCRDGTHKPQPLLPHPLQLSNIRRYIHLAWLWVAGSDVKETKYEMQIDYRPI